MCTVARIYFSEPCLLLFSIISLFVPPLYLPLTARLILYSIFSWIIFLPFFETNIQLTTKVETRSVPWECACAFDFYMRITYSREWTANCWLWPLRKNVVSAGVGPSEYFAFSIFDGRKQRALRIRENFTRDAIQLERHLKTKLFIRSVRFANDNSKL